MLIGVPAEIKEQESRVGLTPASVKELTKLGHAVIIENNAGYAAGFDNSAYKSAGAKITENHRKELKITENPWELPREVPENSGFPRKIPEHPENTRCPEFKAFLVNLEKV